MIKKILLSIFFIIFFAQATFTQEVFRVTSVNFDTSNSMIFLTSPDDVSESIIKNIKLIKLQNPKRVYFDINSAVLTENTQNWFLNSGGVKQIKISQFSTNPGKIRVVLYLDENFNPSQIDFLKVKNNLVIKFKDITCENEYFQNTYRDEHTASSDFYENLSISNDKIENQTIPGTNTEKNDVLNQIQNAFNSGNKLQSNEKIISTEKAETINKELKLKSKYYANAVCAQSSGFLISGFGVVGLEKPLYLTNPARVVFDIPNSIVNSELKNKEFKVGEDSIRIGQFEPNKVRIAITSVEAEKYIPVFSSDGQSILITKSNSINNDELFSKTTDATGYYVRKINPITDEFIIVFNTPVVHSIQRNDSKLIINLYNALRYNEQNFKNSINQTNFGNAKIDLLPQVGLKLTVPLEKDNLINCYLGADGRSVKIVTKGIKPKPAVCSQKTIILPKCNGKKSVVLDAGHGGSDYGAIRCGINEKDITLDITKRVEAILLNKGINITVTRNIDTFVSLEGRTVITAKINPDIFVSIHVNSCVRPEITGIETHYYHPNSLNLAHIIHASLISNIKTNDRGLFKSKFYVINHTCVPAILVEIGFISNDRERAELVSEQRKQQTAQAIADGILKYLNK